VSLRPSTKGERQKLALFLGLLFVVANFFALTAASRHYTAIRAQLEQLRAQLAYNQVWLEDRDLWTQRQRWLTEKQPVLKDTGEANVALIESLQKLAAADNLVIAEQSLKDPRRDAAFQEVSVQLHLVGTLEALCRWLAAVQQPDLFQTVTNFSLKSDEDANKVRCDLTVARWYAP